jgi:predicted HTH transcriptional regulator
MTSLDRKRPDQIDKADIQQLIDDEVQESKTIEYKREIVGNTDEQKKEFLADVSSFANASGGHLIIGIDEDKGIPKQISGLEIADIDKEISRLENGIPIDREALIIPEVMIEKFEAHVDKEMKNIFDVIWNAAGWPSSIHYDESGHWSG